MLSWWFLVRRLGYALDVFRERFFSRSIYDRMQHMRALAPLIEPFSSTPTASIDVGPLPSRYAQHRRRRAQPQHRPPPVRTPVPARPGYTAATRVAAAAGERGATGELRRALLTSEVAELRRLLAFDLTLYALRTTRRQAPSHPVDVCGGAGPGGGAISAGILTHEQEPRVVDSSSWRVPSCPAASACRARLLWAICGLSR